MVQQFFIWAMITVMIICEIFLITLIYKSGSIAYFLPLILILAALIGLILNYEGDKIINFLRRHMLGIVLSVIWCFFVIGVAIYDYQNPNDIGLFISWIYDRNRSVVGFEFNYATLFTYDNPCIISMVISSNIYLDNKTNKESFKSQL